MSIFTDMLLYNAKCKKINYSSSNSSNISKTITLNLTERPTTETVFANLGIVVSGHVRISVSSVSGSNQPEILLKDENNSTVATFTFGSTNTANKTVSVNALHNYKLTYKCTDENTRLPTSVTITYYVINDENLVSIEEA